jgi:large subunit ribosomal protein L4e
MCRKGRMFSPLKTWRRWHRKVNLKQKRHAVAAALAASAIAPLIMARGHRFAGVPNIPCVVDDKVETFEKTKETIAFLTKLGAWEDIERVANSKSVRPGVGKIRGKRFKVRRGPLFIYSNENVKLIHAARNIPGIDLCNVTRLNLKQLAPGGHLGRFIIWTESAFKALNHIFGTYRFASTQKKGYRLHRTVLQNADIAKIINSNEVQSVLNTAKCNKAHHEHKVNARDINTHRVQLNPYYNVIQRMAKEQTENNTKKRQAALKEKRGISKSLTKEQKVALKARKKTSAQWIKTLQKNLDDAHEA